MGAGGVAEVEEGLAGVDGKVGVGEPWAPGRAVDGGLARVFFGCGQGAQGGAALVACGVGAGQAELEEAAGGGVGGAGERVVQQLPGEGVVFLPGGLVGEVADEAGAAVGVAGGVAVVGARPCGVDASSADEAGRVTGLLPLRGGRR
ncbi:hypothetical protein [Streptomyces sp. NPDC018947]|uniref:hypothetical protein n=1 Tax=Streptomyces sp. NPDC018947 TaxID=3365054 RepID=UPI0037A129F5